jgi:hypothetical protein
MFHPDDQNQFPRRLPSSGTPRAFPTKATMDLIGKLALRCEPSGNFDREAYAAKVALLVDDVAHIPSPRLEKAIREWVNKSPYLPKASDLIAGAKPGHAETSDTDDAKRNALADHWNVNLHNTGTHHMRWVAQKDGGLNLVAVANSGPMPKPLSFVELVTAYKAMGETFLKLGIGCGELTEHDADTVRNHMKNSTN